jgi:hypothetical protein
MMTAEIGASPQLPAASRMQGYDKKLRMRATLKDIYVNLPGLYKRTEQAIPNAIYMKVDETEQASNTKVTITMKLPLTGDVVTGNSRLLGNEVSPSTKTGTIYRNNYKFAVKTETYNTRKLDQQAYGLFDQHIKDLGVHAQQFKGFQIRQALLKRFPADMVAGDLLNESGVVPLWNPNVFVQGCLTAEQPSYDSTNQDYINNIADAMYSVSNSWTQSQSGAANFRMLNNIALRALSKKIMPLEIGGADAYILTLSPLSASIFTDPNLTSNNSYGNVWTSYNRLSERVQNWYGVIGKFMSSIGVDIYITVDPKLASILPGGSSAPWTLTPGYVEMGDVDNRNHSNTKTRDCGVLHGKGALVEWEPEKLHMVKHEDDYGRILGTGYAGTRGIQLLTFDSATATDSSIEYYGSMLCIMNRWAYN